ncbi:WecB/TagA/CpsF family glycosyltransferase [Patescibacteria group bacterium]|nr:WecB/TagA/CpsF family glycosyltransferase [Patescibacteria group bacterium]
MKVNILGIQIDNLKKAEALKIAEQFLSDGRQHYIVTPNPEMAVAAQKDEYFLEILNKADLSVPDGFGLILASRYLRRPLLEKIHGVDLMLDICRLAEQKNYSVYLLGGKEGIAKKTAENLLKKFPKLRIAGAESGGIINEQQLATNNQQLNFTRPDILFVAFGAEKQEKWIVQNLNNIPSIKIAMGVGGAFDFISGKIKRAPKWIQKIGLEWLWRLFMQPWRWKRILTATIKFSWLVITKDKKRREASS